MFRSFRVPGAWRGLAVVLVAALLASCAPDPIQTGAEDSRLFIRSQVSNSNFMQFTMTVFGWADDPMALDLLREGLDSSTQGVRNEAIDALVRRGDDASAGVLTEALGTAAGATKLRVAQALARLSREEGRAVLVDSYLGAEMEKKAESAARAIGALAVLDAEAARPFAADRIKIGADDREALYPVLADIETDWARDLILRNMGSDKGAVLNMAIAALGAHGNPADTKKLSSLAEKSATAKEALDALGHVGGEAATTFLKKALEREKNPVFQLHAATALWRAGERDLVRERIQGIAAAADADTKAFQKELAEALDGIDDEETTAILIALYGAVDDADKPSVLSILRHSDSPAVTELMSTVLDNRAGGNTVSDYILASYAIEALVRNAPGQELFDRLVAVRADAEAMPYTRIAAAAGALTLAPALSTGP